jgi:CHAD domain-containing protein
MKARRVKQLSASMSLESAARRIVAVRAGELYSFIPAALNERDSLALHEMRIAAKRLRYVLELVGFCLDESAREAASRARALQTVLGDIHDCDVLLARIEPRTGDAGMSRLAERFRARRHELFRTFCELWTAIEHSGLRERLAAATSPSPEDTPSSR